jgi:hypothetical protein
MPMSGICDKCGHSYTAYQCPNCHSTFLGSSKTGGGKRGQGAGGARSGTSGPPFWVWVVVIVGIFWLIYG